MAREGSSFSRLLSPKSVTKTAFWNVRSLLSTSGDLTKAQEVQRILSQLGVSVCGLADVGRHLRGRGQLQLGSWTLHWSGAAEGAEGWQPSVGLLLSPSAAAALTDVQALGPRLLWARFAGCTSLSLLVAYAPTSAHPEEQAAFLAQLADAEAAVPRRDVLLVLGDFNARVGSASAGDPYLGSCLSWHGVGERNTAGELLLETCAAAGLAVANTWFPHKPAHSFSWLHTDGQQRARIDHVLVRRRRLSCVRDVRVHRHGNFLAPFAGAISDHHLQVCSVQLRLRVRPPQRPRPDISLLREPRNPAAARYAAILDAKILRGAPAGTPPPPAPPPPPSPASLDAALERLFSEAAAAADCPSTPARALLAATPSPSPPPAPCKLAPTSTPRPLQPSPSPSPSPPQAPAKPVVAGSPARPAQALVSPPPAPTKACPGPMLPAPHQPCPLELPSSPAQPPLQPPALPALSWEKLEAAALECAAAALPPSASLARKPWISEEVLALSVLRRAARQAGDKQEERRLKLQSQRLVRKERRRFAWQLGCDMQAAHRGRRQGEMWRLVRQQAERSVQRRQLQLKNTVGRPLSKSQQEAAVVAHFQQALNRPGSVSPAVLAEVECPPSAEEYPPPTVEEFQRGLQRLKFGKAADGQGLSAEHLRAAGPAFQAALHQAVCRIWRGEEAPPALTQAELLPLVKPKGDTSSTKVLRGVSIVSIARKLVGQILCARLGSWLEERLSEEQCGFRRRRGCANQLWTVRRLEELAREYGQELHCCAVDLTAAFDSASRPALWALLRAQGLPEAAVQLLQRLYTDTTCCVRLGGGRKSASFPVSVGVQQGSPDSCPLFNVLMDRVLAEALAAAGDCGVTLRYRVEGHLRQAHLATDASWGSRLVSALLQADDVWLVAPTHAQLQRLLSALSEACRRWQLQINLAKTHYLVVRPGSAEAEPAAAAAAAAQQPPLLLDGQTVGQKQQVEYLGAQFSACGSLDAELSARIKKAAHAFRQLEPTLRLRALGLRAKMQIFEAAVLSTLLYGAHSWALTLKQERRMAAFQMRCLRRLLGISLLDHVRNEAVLARCGQAPMAELLRVQRLLWLGHCWRMGDGRLPKLALFGRLEGVRPRAGPPLRWREDVVRADLEEAGRAYNWARLAEDRGKWAAWAKALAPRRR